MPPSQGGEAGPIPVSRSKSFFILIFFKRYLFFFIFSILDTMKFSLARSFHAVTHSWWGVTPKLLLVAKVGVAALALGGIGTTTYFWHQTQISSQHVLQITDQVKVVQENLAQAKSDLASTSASLETLEATDQNKRNNALEKEISDLQAGLKQAANVYEELLQFKDDTGKASTFSAQLTKAILLLNQRNYASASTQLAALHKSIQVESERLKALAPAIAANVPKNNTAPSAGSQRQVVETDVGTFQVDIIAADLNSTRVVVETASEGTCANDCPVGSLGDFVARAGGYAGVNGPYACPAEYPSCAGKTNSFDTLIMNRKKVYFNSDNNVYSIVPAVIFSGNSARYVEKSLEWGRDTSPDSVIAAQPALILGGQIRFGGDGDPKKISRSTRGFIGTKGSTVYIGIVRGATVAESAHVMKTLGIENALNLDGGGSSALMFNGKYLVGPGRQTPFGIVLVRK